jgi:aminoglycoside phosphotransferase (APT) family kinase protein
MGFAQRDPEATKKVLAEWFEARTGETVRITNIDIPLASGWSNETLLVDTTDRRLVVRVEPTKVTVFLEANFESQYRIMKALAEGTDVPVPAMHWFEPDRSWLGGAFWVMDRVEGVVPADSPPYTTEGFLLDEPPERQRRLWDNGIEAMARVHTVDWRRLGLGFLDDPARGASGLTQQLNYYAEYLEWAEEDRRHDLARAALDWLRANQPPDLPADRLALCWGDSRIGNQMFDGDRGVVAVLDWEMAALGDPQQDLAWFVLVDDVLSEGQGNPRIPGFPRREETIRQWEQHTGRRADAFDYYEVFAGFRFTVVMTRLGHLFFDLGVAPDDFAYDNFVSQHLARLLSEAAPLR